MNQTQIEQLIHPKHIKEDLKQDLIEYMGSSLNTSVKAIKKWLDISEWESKDKRKQAISHLDLHGLVADILTSITMYCAKPMPMVSIASMINIPVFTDTLDNIKTVCELIALLEPVGAYSLSRNIDNSIVIESLLEPSEELLNRLNLYCYLPPMIEKPDILINNQSSGYKTINKDSLILGNKENQHKGEICLDVLNKLNQNRYVLDHEFLANYKKEWFREELDQEGLAELSNQEQSDYHIAKQTWEHYQIQFKTLVKHLGTNTFYLTHKVDKRGRIYSQSYHFNTQGTSFEKACINLKHQELITGDL